MRKILYVSALLLLHSFVFSAEDFADNGEGIYFCTKDLDSLRSSSVTTEKSVSGRDSNYVYVSTDDDSSHTFARHCFVLLGIELHKNNDKTMLKIFDSAGYNVVRGEQEVGLVTAEGWLTYPKERNRFTVSCARITEDRDVSNSEDLEAINDEIYTTWDQLVDDMKKDARKEKYNVKKHNCCSVSYENIRKNKNKLNISAIKKIKKRNYNFMGTGIKFDRDDDSILDYVKGFFRSSSNSVLNYMVFVTKTETKDDDAPKEYKHENEDEDNKDEL